MWGKLVVSVTLLPMLIHSIIGCCWHHGHSIAGNASHCEFAVTVECHGHPHAHEHHAKDESSRTPTCPLPCEHEHERGCDEVRCVYVASESIRHSIAIELKSLVAVFNVVRIFVVAPQTVAINSTDRPPKVIVALQHCALTQVWIV